MTFVEVATFSSRVGPRGEKKRPLEIGLKTEELKSTLFRDARFLKDTRLEFFSRPYQKNSEKTKPTFGWKWGGGTNRSLQKEKLQKTWNGPWLEKEGPESLSIEKHREDRRERDAVERQQPWEGEATQQQAEGDDQSPKWNKKRTLTDQEEGDSSGPDGRPEPVPQVIELKIL